jgi:hypothetical protein
MAQPLSQLQSTLKALEGVKDVYIQGPGPQTMEYPCIRIARNRSFVAFADNVQYLFKKRYGITVIAREPDSPIPDLVEALPFTEFDRFYVSNGLNHFVFNLYF